MNVIEPKNITRFLTVLARPKAQYPSIPYLKNVSAKGLIPLERDVFSASTKRASGAIYNADYYENGAAKGVSCYKNYSWRPDVTLPVCSKYIEFLNLKKGDSVLDYGCAKGFIVKGLRQSGINAKGFDISEYAVSHAPNDVKPFLTNNFSFDKKFDWIISKDVLEHVEKNNLQTVLTEIKNNSNNSFIIVPLGKNGKYVVPENELDITHKIREPIEWWKDQFKKAGLSVEDVRFELPPIKEHQTSKYPEGTAFVVLKSQH